MYTDKEIELATKMKDEDINWNPREGDYFVSSKSGVVELCLGTGMTTEIIHFHDGYADHRWQAICDMEKKDAIWLPSWHQCRKMLQDAGWKHFQLIHNVGCSNGKISASAERSTKILRVLGNTDLEVMYRLILEVVI